MHRTRFAAERVRESGCVKEMDRGKQYTTKYDMQQRNKDVVIFVRYIHVCRVVENGVEARYTQYIGTIWFTA